jgi:hypothetical protein
MDHKSAITEIWEGINNQNKTTINSDQPAQGGT